MVDCCFIRYLILQGYWKSCIVLTYLHYCPLSEVLCKVPWLFSACICVCWHNLAYFWCHHAICMAWMDHRTHLHYLPCSKNTKVSKWNVCIDWDIVWTTIDNCQVWPDNVCNRAKGQQPIRFGGLKKQFQWLAKWQWRLVRLASQFLTVVVE